MPLVFNGVTIPENVANAFSFNGANITDVYFNGVQVWHQSLFNAVWSGNSLYTYNGNIQGIQTSGALFRMQIEASYGTWLTADINGLPTGSSTCTMGIYTRGFVTTAPNIFKLYYTHDQPSTYITFTKGVGFTGSSLSGVMGFSTSGGLIRAQDGTAYYGAYISLT